MTHLLCYKRFLFEINAVPFYSLKNPEKKLYHSFTKILRSMTVFNTDNNKKCFLSIKSAYKNDF